MTGLLKRLIPRGMKERMRRLVFSGETVFCPVCEKGAIAFLPMGTPPRPHVLCPFCESMERTRMMCALMQQRGVLRNGAHVLHVAPERGLAGRLRAMKQIHYVAGDKHEPGYLHPPGTMELDVTALPFTDARFDVVICSHVLEHVPDDRKAIHELHRVLKRGGFGLLVVPMDPLSRTTLEDPSITDPAERIRLFRQHDHVRLYGLDYADRLAEAGFSVEVLDMTAGMDPAEVFRLGFSGELLHVVTK